MTLTNEQHSTTQIIPPRSGTAFLLHKGEYLTVIDPQGEQVADLIAINADDKGEMISSGRSLDFQNTIFLTTGHAIYSNRSNVLLRIIEDRVGRHDFLLSPCSKEMFQLTYGDIDPVPGCFGNLSAALKPFGINPDHIPVAFNIFMHVTVDGASGALAVKPPLSKAGDFVTFRAETNLLIGLTACSALQSNNFAFKPIHYRKHPVTSEGFAVLPVQAI